MMKREEARKRAEELVGKMTVLERASQLRYDAPGIPRLNIPAYNWWNEGLHGVARAGQATVFPQAIGMAATFDTNLVGKMADVVAEEGRAKYNVYSKKEDRDIYKGLTFWSPNVNIFRDPRWGRGHETYGEDPYLTKTLGVAFVKSLQGDGEYMKAAACAKHFAVHSGPEAIRHEFDAVATEKDMAETYFPAFEALVKEAGVEAVMGAYNRVNGEVCCGSPSLQRKLRSEWGFQGHFVSDCWAIRDFHEHHMVTGNAVESAALAMNNGTDLNCGNTYLYVYKAYEKGLVSEETVTEAAIRLYTTRFLLGMFDETAYDQIPYTVVECEEHLALSRKAAEESFVLLKNDGLLPLDKQKLHTVGIIGPNADSRAALVGNYHGTASRYVTIQEGIQDYLGDGVRVLTSVGCELFEDRTEKLAYQDDRLAEAKAVADHSDVVILCVGLDETLEGEEGDTGNSYASGDKETLKLPESQLKLMEAVASCEKPTVLCLMAGSDIDLSYAAEHFDAVLMLWYPGAQGGHAAARILFGEVSPSGKLPVTFYETLEELPEFTDYAMKGRTYRFMEHKAQYPFGYGLTYGNVIVTGCEVIGDAAGHSDQSTDGAYVEHVSGEETPEKVGNTSDAEALIKISVSVRMKNVGVWETDDVIQIYVKNQDSPLAVPNPQLSAYQRVHLKANEEKEIFLTLDPRAFLVADETGNWIRDGKHFEIYAGCSQPDERSVELTGIAPVRIELEL